MERYIVMRIMFGLFLLFVTIFFIVQLATSGGDDSAETETPAEIVDAPFIPSDENNDSSEIKFTVMGKINAPEDHREFRFTITQRSRQVDLIEGYDGKVIKSLRLPNTPNSYQELLNAIESEGFTREKAEPTITDSRGYCSNGKKYFYVATTNGLTRSDLWSASCARRAGTFGGDRIDIVRLFERQFPDFSDFRRGSTL